MKNKSVFEFKQNENKFYFCENIKEAYFLSMEYLDFSIEGDRQYYMRYQLGENVVSFCKEGNELRKWIKTAIYWGRVMAGMDPSMASCDDLFWARTLSSAFLITYCTLKIKGPSKHIRRDLIDQHGPDVVKAVTKCMKGKRNASEFVNIMICSYMLTKLLNRVDLNENAVLINDTSLSEREIQEAFSKDDLESTPGFGKLWDSEEQLHSLLRQGVLTTEYYTEIAA